jgi:hypothetical protein
VGWEHGASQVVDSIVRAARVVPKRKEEINQLAEQVEVYRVVQVLVVVNGELKGP